MAVHTLYLSYFGLREPLVQTQVLPYLRQLVAGNYQVSLLTFEAQARKSWTEEELKAATESLAREGIRWVHLPYHKRPSLPATLVDIIAGARLAARLIRKEKVEVLHARGHVAAAMGALAKRLAGGRLLFDMRSFMPEEYTDAGIWKSGGYVYRMAKAAESWSLKNSDAFVVLTEKARELLFPGCLDADRLGRPVEVIPCCVDLERFEAAVAISRDDVRRELDVEKRRVIAYVGALGGWYLNDRMIDFLAFARAQNPATFALILTQSDPQMVSGQLDKKGFTSKDYLIRKVSPRDVPRYLKAADVALSFIKPCFSKLSSSPTKMAEYLASGLPVICNAGIGDVDELVQEDKVGVIIKDFNDEEYASALNAVDEMRRDPDITERCRLSARRRFDLEMVGGERYRRLYGRLLDTAGTENLNWLKGADAPNDQGLTERSPL